MKRLLLSLFLFSAIVGNSQMNMRTLPERFAFGVNDTILVQSGKTYRVRTSVMKSFLDGLYQPLIIAGGVPVFKTLAALRALTTLQTDIVYYVTDYGYHPFIWNPTSTATDDIGKTIDPTGLSGPGRLEAISPNNIYPITWFGAKADGTNQSTAINAAFAAASGGKVYIPSGIFNCKDIIVPSNIIIEGEGTLRTHSSAGYNTGNVLLNITLASNVFIRGITLDGNKGVVPGDADGGATLVKIDRCNGVVMDGIKLMNNGYLAVAVTQSVNTILNKSYIYRTDVGFITFGSCDKTVISNNIVDNGPDGTSEAFAIWSYKDGTGTYWDRNTTITGNVVKKKVSLATIRYANGVTVTGNIADSCLKGLESQLQSGVAYHVIATGNQFNHTQNALWGCWNYLSFFDNTIVNTTANAIVIGNSSVKERSNYVYINGNTIINTNTAGVLGTGIYMSNVNFGTVSNNTLTDDFYPSSTQYSIRLLDTTNNITIRGNKAAHYTVSPFFQDATSTVGVTYNLNTDSANTMSGTFKNIILTDTARFNASVTVGGNITTTGKIGVNVTTPNASLDVKPATLAGTGITKIVQLTAPYATGTEVPMLTVTNASNVSKGGIAFPLGGGGSNGDIAIYGTVGAGAQTETVRFAGTGSVGIGQVSPAATSILDIASTTKGVLFPRMSTTQRTAITLDGTNDGLMVYDVTLHKLFINENGTWVQK